MKEKSFEEWLKYIEKRKDKKSARSIKQVPSKTYFLIRKDDNKIIGMIHIRLELSDDLKKSGGHIGYSIRPTERKKGYAKINLYLGLLECQKNKLPKVMLTCDIDNYASKKTIKSLGGVLTNTLIDPIHNLLLDVYWIEVDKALLKYKKSYEPYLKSLK